MYSDPRGATVASYARADACAHAHGAPVAALVASATTSFLAAILLRGILGDADELGAVLVMAVLSSALLSYVAQLACCVVLHMRVRRQDGSWQRHERMAGVSAEQGFPQAGLSACRGTSDGCSSRSHSNDRSSCRGMVGAVVGAVLVAITIFSCVQLCVRTPTYAYGPLVVAAAAALWVLALQLGCLLTFYG